MNSVLVTARADIPTRYYSHRRVSMNLSLSRIFRNDFISKDQVSWHDVNRRIRNFHI